MSEALIDLGSIQQLLDSLNNLTKNLNTDINPEGTTPSIDDDSFTKMFEDALNSIKNQFDGQTQAVKNVVSTIPTHRTIEYIHVYKRPTKTIQMDERVAEDIYYFVDQAFTQANAVLSILPQLVGDPADYYKWAQGIRTLLSPAIDLLPSLPSVLKSLTVKQGEKHE